MSIETKAKELVKIQKRREKLKSQLYKIDEEITLQKETLRDIFKGLGLDSSFSHYAQGE